MKWSEFKAEVERQLKESGYSDDPDISYIDTYLMEGEIGVGVDPETDEIYIN